MSCDRSCPPRLAQTIGTFTWQCQPYCDDRSHVLQYGLIAEAVGEVAPELVVRDAAGDIQTVRYQFLPTLLVAEVQRLEQERKTQADEIKAPRRVPRVCRVCAAPGA